MAHPLPARLFEELDDVERVADAFGAEAEVLVEFPDPLGVQVDVEQLVLPQGLGDRVRERQAAHRLVRELRVEADHLGSFEHADEGQRMADRGQQDVATRLVGLGFQRDAQPEPSGLDVLADEVDALLVPIEGQPDIFGCVGLHPLAPTPHDEDLRVELGAQLGGLAGLADGQTTNLWVVGGQRAFLEDRPEEEVRRHHRDAHARGVERATELLHDLLALVGRAAERHEVVVVEAHAVGTELGQLLHRRRGFERLSHLSAERIPTAVAHGPQSEREVVLRAWSERIAHVSPVLRSASTSRHGWGRGTLPRRRAITGRAAETIPHAPEAQPRRPTGGGSVVGGERPIHRTAALPPSWSAHLGARTDPPVGILTVRGQQEPT